MTQKYIALTPLENLKGFATSRPPIIVFIVCLGLVGIVLMTLAFYIKDGELKTTADITEDWNGFLESFSDVEFCIQNGSFPSSVSSSLLPFTAGPVTGSPMLTTSAETLRNYSISMMLAIQPTPEFVSIPHNLTMVSGYISGSDLGLKGRAATERITVAAQLPFNWNMSQCGSSASSLLNNCALVHIYTCVTFQAPEHVFPLSRGPAVCEIMNSTGVEYHANMRGRNSRDYAARPCRAKPIVHIKYKLDPTLTVLLTLSDRSLINLHLLHTSYFLFVMTITVLLYAMVRGRPMKLKLTSPISLPFTANSDI